MTGPRAGQRAPPSRSSTRVDSILHEKQRKKLKSCSGHPSGTKMTPEWDDGVGHLLITSKQTSRQASKSTFLRSARYLPAVACPPPSPPRPFKRSLPQPRPSRTLPRNLPPGHKSGKLAQFPCAGPCAAAISEARTTLRKDGPQSVPLVWPAWAGSGRLAKAPHGPRPPRRITSPLSNV